MTASTEGLLTVQDFIRWGASRFNEAGLFFGHGTDNAIDEAVLLVLHALHLGPDLPATYRDCRLTPPEREAVQGLLEQRIRTRTPAAYLTREAWFAGLSFYVDESVLIPRSPLGELIETGFEPWVEPDDVGRVLDLCAGSGCIGIAVAEYLPYAEVDLADNATRALAVAARNVAEHGLEDRVRVIESDRFSALGDRVYDLIVCNPPYVGAAELAALPPEYHHEPSSALAGGDSGLDLVLAILAEAPDYLSADGVLIMEVGSAVDALERRFPDVPFLWLELERGGEGVFLMRRDQLVEIQSQVRAALEES